MPRKTVKARITGRVQGVAFRAWTRDAARDGGLEGWVRNADDGSVEAVFSGPADAVDAMLALCREGPPSARVDDIEISEGDLADVGEDFSIRY